MIKRLDRIDKLKMSLYCVFGVKYVSIDLNNLREFLTDTKDTKLTVEIGSRYVTFDYSEETEEFTFNFNSGD